MTTRPPAEGLDGVGFRRWLQGDGVSEKVASDYLSRCKRVQAALGVNLAAATVTEESFVQLMKDIQRYSMSLSRVKTVNHRITGSLRSAVRKFARYTHGKRVDRYRKNHGLSSYTSLERNE